MLFGFSNARSILELMLCNSHLTKLDILTLLSSDCRAWATKLSKHLKKWTNHVFVFTLPVSTLIKNKIPHFLFIFFLFFFLILNLYLFSLLNTFSYITNVIKVVKNLMFQKSFTSHEINWTLLFFFVSSFSLAGPKTKAESSNSQQ